MPPAPAASPPAFPRRIEVAAAPAPVPHPSGPSPPPGGGRRIPTWVEAATGYGLAMVAMVAATGAVLSGGWVDGATATLIVAAVAVTEAILLGRSGLTRLALIALAIPLCAAVVIPVTIGVIPDDGQTGIRHLLVRYAVAAATGIFDTDPWAFTVGLATLVWLCGYWLGWLAFRERRGILAVLPVVVVLAVNALNASSTAHYAVPEAIAVAAVVLLVGNVELGSLEAGWRWRRVPVLPRLHSRYTTSMAVATAAIVAVGLAMPPATNSDISGRFFPSAGLGGSGGNAGTGGGGGGQDLVQFNVNTEPGGPLHSVPRPVLTYFTDQAVTVYLRVVNDTVFSAGNWLPAGASGGGESIDSTVGLPAGSLPRVRDPAVLGAATTSIGLHMRAFFTNPTGSDSFALFPGEPDTVNHDYTVVGVKDRATNNFLAVDSVSLNTDPNKLTRLDSTGLIPTATEAQLRAAGTAYPAFAAAEANLTAESSSDQDQLTVIHDYAVQWSAGTGNPYDAAVAIEQHLRAYAYTLSPPTPPGGEWPIVYFLTSSHRGYCQYFAASMGAMLRSLKIPARVVSGYGPGSIDESAGARPGVVGHSVSTSDAHSWVEAYFPNYGWIPFEPTPPSSEGAYQPFTRGPQVVTATPPPGRTLTPAARPGATPTSAPAAAGAASGGSGPSLAIWLAPVLALVVLVGLVAAVAGWWRRPRSLAGAWRRLWLAGRAVGIRPDPAETRTAYADRLAGALGGAGDLRGELGTVVSVTGKAEFGRDGIDGEDQGRWRSAWAQIARGLPPLLRQHRRRLRRS